MQVEQPINFSFTSDYIAQLYIYLDVYTSRTHSIDKATETTLFGSVFYRILQPPKLELNRKFKKNVLHFDYVVSV